MILGAVDLDTPLSLSAEALEEQLTSRLSYLASEFHRPGLDSGVTPLSLLILSRNPPDLFVFLF